jgi:hypothetical protein
MINALDQASVAVLQPVHASGEFFIQRHTATRLKEAVAGAARCEPGPKRRVLPRRRAGEPRAKFLRELERGTRCKRPSAREQARDHANRQTLKRASNGENLDGANDEDIPDYVMRDFDPSEEPDGRLEASSGCGTKSPCDWVYIERMCLLTTP